MVSLCKRINGRSMNITTTGFSKILQVANVCWEGEM